jgi:hypothetical protein
MLEHSFYQALNLWQIVLLSLSAQPWFVSASIQVVLLICIHCTCHALHTHYTHRARTSWFVAASIQVVLLHCTRTPHAQYTHCAHRAHYAYADIDAHSPLSRSSPFTHIGKEHVRLLRFLSDLCFPTISINWHLFVSRREG